MGTVTGDRVVAVPDGSGRSVELAIGGMTCASCAARVEKKLNKIDGVTATVNLATETARVTFPTAIRAEELVAAVEQAGYTAALPPVAEPASAEPAGGPQPASERDQAASLHQRLLVSLALTVPVVVMAVPAAQFRNWQWAPCWHWPRRWRCGGRGRSTAPPSPTHGMGQPPWTR